MINLADCNGFADSGTPQELLPPSLRRGENDRRMRYLKRELMRVIRTCLTEKQRHCIYLHYWKGVRVGEIAGILGVACPQISKSIGAAKRTIEAELTQFLDLYERLERELLDELS